MKRFFVDVDSDGRISVRVPEAPRLGDSITVCSVGSREDADSLVINVGRHAYPDAGAAKVAEELGYPPGSLTGAESLVAAGCTGYLVDPRHPRQRRRPPGGVPGQVWAGGRATGDQVGVTPV